MSRPPGRKRRGKVGEDDHGTTGRTKRTRRERLSVTGIEEENREQDAPQAEGDAEPGSFEEFRYVLQRGGSYGRKGSCDRVAVSGRAVGGQWSPLGWVYGDGQTYGLAGRNPDHGHRTSRTPDPVQPSEFKWGDAPEEQRKAVLEVAQRIMADCNSPPERIARLR